MESNKNLIDRIDSVKDRVNRITDKIRIPVSYAFTAIDHLASFGLTCDAIKNFYLGYVTKDNSNYTTAICEVIGVVSIQLFEYINRNHRVCMKAIKEHERKRNNENVYDHTERRENFDKRDQRFE